MMRLFPSVFTTFALLTQAQNVTQNSTSSSFSPTPVSTTVPSPTVALNTTVPGEGIYPPLQQWCNMGMNDTFCPGVAVELSGIFADSKPTYGILNDTFRAFDIPPTNATVGDIQTFVNQYFKGEGLDLSQVPVQGFNATPEILNNVNDPVLKAFVSQVNSFWSLLIRETNQSALCNGQCESSLIPLNSTIVVPGGRYREICYWDSRWIIEGLLQSQLYDYAWDLLQNFMDLIETYGFLPNGGRKYYLNRSQPPVFISGYVEDYTTAMGASPVLNDSARGDLYAELASGAESGWDYSARWCKEPVINVSDNNPALRTLNVRAMIPVDLNSLLSGDHALLANYYEIYASSPSANATLAANTTAQATFHRQAAADLSAAVLDLNWDPAKSWFYDFDTTANARSDVYTPAGTFALWQNITPPQIIQNEAAALQVVSGIRYLLGKYSGIPSVASLLLIGLNWDFPNAWPPHVYTSIKAFETLGRAVGNASTLGNLTLPFGGVAPNQLGLNESGLQPQPASTLGNTSLAVPLSQNQPWPLAVSIDLANRYMQAAFCSWYSTGGSIPGVLTQLPLSDLNATGTFTEGQNGQIFEKFNATDTDAAGGGGEYTVQIGFGWTNGVILWAAGEFGEYLPAPTCPLIPIVARSGGMNGTSGGMNTTMNSTQSAAKRLSWRTPSS